MSEECHAAHCGPNNLSDTFVTMSANVNGTYPCAAADPQALQCCNAADVGRNCGDAIRSKAPEHTTWSMSQRYSKNLFRYIGMSAYDCVQIDEIGHVGEMGRPCRDPVAVQLPSQMRVSGSHGGLTALKWTHRVRRLDRLETSGGRASIRL